MKDLRIEKTKTILLKTLWNLLTEKSMIKISVKDICEKSQIGRATFYNHFGDKYDLFEYLIAVLKQEVFEKPTQEMKFDSISAFYKELIKIGFNYIEQNKVFFSKMLINNNDDMIRDLLLGTMVKSLEEKLNKDKKHLQLPTNIIATYYVGGFVSLAIWWLQTPNKFSKDEMIVYANNLMENSILI